ncbi:MarR family winged helix-turn-helix transcriptional regulator [Antarcticirhabdus aurantiaca]|uniref:MarR family winged helix-turn-helix transcriptional regulator n=1 Tax=Antarcticirhabdus aurantiaca TaxID=2606717 RepID=UPI00131BC474
MGLQLAEFGLHPGRDRLLLALYPGGSVSVSILTDVLNVRPSTVSKMLDRMLVAGLAVREPDPAEGCRTMVSITPAGMDAQERIREVRRRLEPSLRASPARSDAMQSGPWIECTRPCGRVCVASVEPPRCGVGARQIQPLRGQVDAAKDAALLEMNREGHRGGTVTAGTRPGSGGHREGAAPPRRCRFARRGSRASLTHRARANAKRRRHT